MKQDLAQTRQLQRLKYIDLCAYVLGCINRKFLMNRFDVKEAWATRDFTAYQQMSGEGLVYDHALKAYKPQDWFAPLFEHRSSDAIQLISDGTQSILCEQSFADNAYSYSIDCVEPDLANIYGVLRALFLKRKVEIDYISRSSGSQTRLIAPHSLIKTGCFTYVRAFDHKSGEFRSFKLKRIIQSNFKKQTPSIEQLKGADHEWNKDVRLTIVANNQSVGKEAIEYDFGLVDGKLEVTLKEALVIYFLMDWNIAPIEYSTLPETLFPLRLLKIVDNV